MLPNILIFNAALSLLYFVPRVHGATAADVVNANNMLVNETDILDIAIVAITASTPPATASVNTHDNVYLTWHFGEYSDSSRISGSPIVP